MRSSKRDAAGVFGRSRELFEQVVAGWRTPAMPRSPPHMVAGQLRTDTIRSLQKSRTQMSFTDKAKDKAQELAGQAKEKTGEATGDQQLQAEGQTDQTAGNLKQAGEDVKDAFGK